VIPSGEAGLRPTASRRHLSPDRRSPVLQNYEPSLVASRGGTTRVISKRPSNATSNPIRVNGRSLPAPVSPSLSKTVGAPIASGVVVIDTTFNKPRMIRFGTPRDQKKHVVLVGGHFIVAQQRSQVVKTVLDWLDERLGPVNPTSQASR
jgi:hypothetical protein